ncbi:MAG: disulfide bond formation protein B [Alphaproteobacteria bacterium]|nr:disulfide bond formation protein B [Alphaproteobacteria bacterium]
MTRQHISSLNILGLVGITSVLLMGVIVQFALGELPCPLCLLQRIGFSVVMFGFMLNVIYGPQQRHYGVILLAALFGAATSLRQISLHVIPGTPGYGSSILGYHYYTWAFIIFAMTILGVAVLLALWNKAWNAEAGAPHQTTLSGLGRFACLAAIGVVLLNVGLTFVECGPYQCPDNPVSYWLMD